MNEIEFPTDLIDYRERGAANADDASAIRARSTPPANEPDAGTVPSDRESRVDSATQERLKKIRAGGSGKGRGADETRPVDQTSDQHSDRRSGDAGRRHGQAARKDWRPD